MSTNYEDWTIRGGGIRAEFTAFIGLQYNNYAELPDKAVEQGSFFTSNKWETPYDVSITVAKSGEVGDIRSFLESLDEMVKSLEMCEVVTPAKSFVNGNVLGIDYKWSNEEYGPRMLEANIHVREVRLVGQSSGSGSGGGGAAGGGGLGITGANFGTGNSNTIGAGMGGATGAIRSSLNPEANGFMSQGRTQGMELSAAGGMVA